MKISPLLLMAALCGLVVPAHAAPAETPAGRVAYAPVALQTTDINALLIADVEMDGKSGRFLIDSGASSAMVVNQAFADSLGKTGTAGADIHGIAGNSASKRAMFTGIRVGKTIRMDDQQLNIIMINSQRK